MLDHYLMPMGVPSLGLHLFLLIWGHTSKALQLNSGWKLISAADDVTNATSGLGPRAGAAVWTDNSGRAWLFGGRGPAAAANTTRLWADLWLYDTQLQTWQLRIPHGSAAGRELSAMCAVANSTVAIFGGLTDARGTTGELLVWRPGQLQFQRRLCSGACPTARYDAMTWCDTSAMHIAGGFDANDRHLTDAWTLDLGTMAWVATPPPPTPCNATAQLWQAPSGALYLMCDDALSNAQLWARDVSGPWRLEAESGRSVITWPGLRRHGGACVGASGDLWLFGGQSQIGDLRYLNNDVWTYEVASRAWLKAELPSDAEEPAQRHLATGFCSAGAMWVFGGASCHDASVGDCLMGDMWMLNVSVEPAGAMANISMASLGTVENVTMASSSAVMNVTMAPSSAVVNVGMVPSSAMVNVTRAPSSAVVNATMASLGATDKMSTGGSLVLDSGGRLRSEIPGLHSASAAESAPDDIDHGAYGSMIFFGISLSMFAAFGLIVFFRRCVSCPPRDGGLLKEAPPVRYTVIPDDAYSI